MYKVDVKQGTKAWLDWRREGIGGSDACVIHQTVEWSDPFTLWYEKKGYLPEQPDNPAMARGRKYEPVIREFMERELDCKLEPLCLEHERYPWHKSSMDGIGTLPDGRIVAVEIKVPGIKVHQEVCAGRLALKYAPQVYHQMMTTGNRVDVMYFVSGFIDIKDPNCKTPDIKYVRVPLDEACQKMLFEKEQEFVHSLSLETCPYEGSETPRMLNDMEFVRIAEQYVMYARNYGPQITPEMKKLQEHLFRLANGKPVTGGGVSILPFHQLSTIERAVMKRAGISTDYNKDAISETGDWQIKVMDWALETTPSLPVKTAYPDREQTTELSIVG